MIEIRMLTLGFVNTNCYIVGDTETGEAVVIDPVDDDNTIYQTAHDEGWTIKLILATHAHFDHIIASKALKDRTGARFIIHREAVPMLAALPEQGLRFFGTRFPEAATPDQLFGNDRAAIALGAIKLEPLYTPGHAPGHVSFFMPAQKTVFCGDCLFKDGIGRTDLPGGNYTTLMHSIIDVLLPLGDDVAALSGHGEATTLGRERKLNPFLLNYRQ
jgi:glyoxylase-like metal-dependent hydrolase (beta-lactamase superfamily II)